MPRAETTCDASPEEETIYGILADLRRLSAESKNKEALVQWGLYKLFLSSPEACLSTVRHRLEKLPSGSDEVPRFQKLAQAVSGLRIEQTSRYRLLKTEFAKMGWNGKPASPRVLLFSESRETQDALVRALAKEYALPFSDKPVDQQKQALAFIHGGFADTDLMNAVEAIGTGSSPVRMLVATDVASEGVNLHHECHNIIHYDLPWSIITLIQRNAVSTVLARSTSPFSSPLATAWCRQSGPSPERRSRQSAVNFRQACVRSAGAAYRGSRSGSSSRSERSRKLSVRLSRG